MNEINWPRVEADAIESCSKPAVDASVRTKAQRIVEDIQRGGIDALRDAAAAFDGRTTEQPLMFERRDLNHALQRIAGENRELLERSAERIQTFARAQLNALTEVRMPVPGGEVGHDIVAVERAGCYAPGGQYPLPSSVLMTAVPARVAGCAAFRRQGKSHYKAAPA